MNHEKEYPFTNLDLPEVRQPKEHKKRLRQALLLACIRRQAHPYRSEIQMFGNALIYIFKTMTTAQKGFAFSALALALIFGAAGLFGPSAYSVANAQAQETINRAFVRLANLTNEQREALEEKFRERMFFKKESHGRFLGIGNVSPEDLDARQEQMQASLADALAEAKAAPDLRIISADELPVPGFFSRAGRAIGFKMMHKPENLEERFINLPQDVREKLEEHDALHQEMKPVSFMVYTNPDGQTVYLGLNEKDEPVVKFVQPKEGEFPFPPHGNGILFRGLKKDTE